MHHCIQGWSGIAEWGGLPLAKLVEIVGPAPEVRFAVFRSFGEGLHGGEYYDCHSIANVLHPQSILAYEMNGASRSADCTAHRCGSGSRTSSATRWSSGSGRSSSSPVSNTSARATAARTRTTNTMI